MVHCLIFAVAKQRGQGEGLCGHLHYIDGDVEAWISFSIRGVIFCCCFFLFIFDLFHNNYYYYFFCLQR